MNRERAETHLRQLAEAELRRATAPGALSRGYAVRLPLVAQALVAAGAVDVGTADQIRAELDLALAARYRAAGALPYAPRTLGGDGEVTLELAIAPPLEAGTPRIDLMAAGPSAQVESALPLSWTWNP